MNSIKISNLKFSYNGKIKVLDGIDLEIKQGEFVGIVGDSGCGKSTLCHILCGIIPEAIKGFISANQALVGGKELRECRLRDLAETVGFVMQDPDRQIVTSTVEDELAFGPENMCIDSVVIKQRVDEALELFGLSKLRRENPNNLSGGQKQMVTIASVFTLNPTIVIIDEPFGHLDEDGRARVHCAISTMQNLGKTVIVVDHNHDELRNADRIIMLENGKIKSTTEER